MLVLTVTSTEQDQLIRDLLASRHLALETATYQYVEPLVEQLLGRDSVAHHARTLVQKGFQHVPNATHGLAMAAGIDMAPEGMFVICAALGMTRNGRQIIGWSAPRLIPETVGRDVSKGGQLATLLQSYREQWKPVDLFSQIDIDELINHHAAYNEAAIAAIDGLFQVRP